MKDKVRFFVDKKTVALGFTFDGKRMALFPLPESKGEFTYKDALEWFKYKINAVIDTDITSQKDLEATFLWTEVDKGDIELIDEK